MVVPAVSSGASQDITPDGTCCTFTAPNFTIDAGTLAVFDNHTRTVHDVNASTKGPDGKALFRSKQFNNDSGPVDGTQYLAPGTYRFICTIHLGMRSSLTVLPGGKPNARSSAAVVIPGQKLGKVASDGKLTVRVKGETAAAGIVLNAKKGNRRLGVARDVTVAAGRTKTVRIKLTPSGVRALRGGSAAVTVEAAVPFGKASKASRTLRG